MLSTVPSDVWAQFLDRIKGTQIFWGLTGGQSARHISIFLSGEVEEHGMSLPILAPGQFSVMCSASSKR